MHLPGPGISRFAIATAAVALLLIAVGALSSGLGGDATGSLLAGLPGHAGLVNGRYHLYLALAADAMVILLLIGITPANVPGWVRATGWIMVALFGIDSAIMAYTPAPPVGLALAVTHAILAPLCLTTVVMSAFYLPQDWINGPEMIDLTPAAPVSTLALLTPLAVIVQIALGTAYRHKVYSVLPHMAGALVATLLLLVLSVQLLQSFPGHPTLRPAAIASMSVLLLQVTLGITAFVMRLLDFDTTTGFLFIAVAHICAGGANSLRRASYCVSRCAAAPGSSAALS